MPILYGADASPLMADPDLDGREQHDEHRLKRLRPLHAPQVGTEAASMEGAHRFRSGLAQARCFAVYQTNRCGTNDSAVPGT